jgi:hypothetical protein
MERVYLDICSLKRPFDDQRQPRVREEAMAVGAIVGRAEAGQIAALGFGALDAPYLAFAERAEAAWSVTCDEKAVEAGRLGDAFREDDPGRGDCVEERRELFGDLMLDEAILRARESMGRRHGRARESNRCAIEPTPNGPGLCVTF